MQRISPLALASVVFSSVALAQNPGFCGDANAPINVEGLTTAANGNVLHNLFVGACRDKNGETWATCGNPTAAQPGKIVRFNAAGAYVAAYAQPAFATTTFAIRDVAYDGNNTIWGSCEVASSGGVIAAFDITTQTWDLNTGAGGKAWKAPAGAATVRGLTYDPLGDSGNGSMYTSNFTSTMFEFKRDGTIIRSFAPTLYGAGAAPYGLAIDFTTRTLWTFSQGGSTHTNAVSYTGYNVIAALDISQNPPVVSPVRGFGSPAGGGEPPYATPIGGGCEITVIGGRKCLTCLNQGLADNVVNISLEYTYAAGCGGKISMSGDGPWAGNPAWGVALNNSTATSAFLILGAGEAVVPLPPTISNCAAQIPLGTWLVLGGQPVVGGTAVQGLPIPGGIPPGKINFQWIELGAGLPVNLSAAAACVVGHF